jgi:hypothetical protein
MPDLLATLDTELCRERDATVPLSAVRNSDTLALADVLAPDARRPPAAAALTGGGRSPRVVRTVDVLATEPGRDGCLLVVVVPVRDDAADCGRGAGETLTLTVERAYLGVVVPEGELGEAGEPGSARVGTGGLLIVGEGGPLSFALPLPLPFARPLPLSVLAAEPASSERKSPAPSSGVSFESGRSPASASSSFSSSLDSSTAFSATSCWRTLRAPRGVGMLRLSTLTRMLLCCVWMLRLCWSASFALRSAVDLREVEVGWRECWPGVGGMAARRSSTGISRTEG